MPNLLYNSTYALNNSYSKFFHINLYYAVGYFRSVIRFGGHTGPDKSITIDIESWEQLKTHFNTFEEYLCGKSEFAKHGKYAKIYFPHHHAELINAYGSRTVANIERPQVIPPPFSLRDEHEAQQFEFENDNANQEVASSISSEEPPKKRMKTLKPASKIMMQHTTFTGLQEFRDCIDYKLKKLEEMSGFVNRVFGIMIDIMKTEVMRKKL